MLNLQALPLNVAAMPSASRPEPLSYSISDLAREFALTTRTIRFYEDEGLLSPRRAGSRRIYAERERVRIKLILRGKRLGLSLSEIRELLDLYEATKGERHAQSTARGYCRRAGGDRCARTPVPETPATRRERERLKRQVIDVYVNVM